MKGKQMFLTWDTLKLIIILVILIFGLLILYFSYVAPCDCREWAEENINDICRNYRPLVIYSEIEKIRK